MAFEDEFAIEIPDAEAEKIQTVAQAVEYLASHPQALPRNTEPNQPPEISAPPFSETPTPHNPP